MATAGSPNQQDSTTASLMSIFEDVQKTFLNSLSDRERNLFKQFPDAKSMIASAEKIAKSSVIHKTRLTACLNNVRNLADRLAPFFEICSIFVSSNPKVAALVWGSIRLVFQLGSNHVTFLEKICDMFAQMQRVLPAYNEIIEQLLSPARIKDAGMPTRMLSTMAFVYSDVVRFCFDACSIFTKRRSVLGLKWPLAATLFWQPFDTKFESILKRFKEHKELMQLEMDASASVHILNLNKKVDLMFKNAESQSKVQEEALEIQKRITINQRIESLRNWINPPSWLNLHETAQGRRIPDTSNWFLKSPPVQSWLQRIGPNVPSSHCNIISFQGKPGYGKTTLCSALIGYLSSDYESSTSTPTSRNVVFFYFDKQSGQAREASHALRAILAQLLQIHGGSDRGIDIASLLWYQARSGQHVASENEAKELLSLICSQTDQLVLVLDGIDECTNEKELFTSLDHVGFTSSNHSIAFFGRPTVPLPKRMSTRAQKIMLSNEQNSGDIRRYLRCKVNDMIDDDVLPENLNGEKTVEKIAVRANGMFLWVTLLVEYLYLASPALTMSQRRHTIDNLTRLEGLDALYGAIIESILAKYSGEARQNIQHLFQWVVCSSRPLLVSELSCAIAVPRDRKLEDDDSFGDLSLSLSRLSGALLEISPTKVVRFIHLSALEYFKDWSLPITDGKTSATQHQHSFVSFCGPDAYIYCSVVCLSYIYHTVGAGPLSGSTQMSLDSTALEKRYPFLKYVSEFLFPHMLKAITVVESDISTLDLGRFIPLLDLARLFLSSKDSITTWIEICWTFGRKPQVVNGEDQIAKILENLTLDRRFMEPFGHCIESLSKLAEDLHHLNKQWSKVLAQSPNEIWEPSISAFLKSDLWVSVDGSRLIPLDSGVNESDFVVVKSRVSADGTKLAIIKVQPPVPGVTYSNSKWMVRHTILSLKSMEMEIQTSFHIPSSMVPFSHIWEHKTDSEGDKPILEFIFPTTISSDLQHATFLNLAGSLVNQDVLISSGSTKILKTRPKMLLQVINTSLQTDPDVCGSFNFDWSTFHNGFWSHMSESGEFLLVLHVLPADVAKQIDKSADIPRAKVWFVRVYRNEAFSEQRGPSFTLLSAIAFVPDQITELKDRPFTFHPELPLLVFASGRTAWIERTDGEMGFSILRIRDTGSEAITLIWNFALKGSKPLNIGSLMRDVSFSNDGTNLYGTADSKKIMVEVPFDKMGIHGPPEVAGESKALVISSQQVSLNSSGAIAALSNGPSPMTQDPNSLVFGQDAQGETVVTDLRQSHEHGALVLRTLRDQTMTQETLTRLPSWVDEGFEATLLNRTRENGHHPDGVVRVMLNRAARPFEKYKSSDSSNVPTLLERDLQTVPRFTVQADHLLGDAETTKQRLRLK